MAIRLTWSDKNAAVADGVYIYRDTVPIPANALPTPLATLPGNAISYDDTTALRNTVYYYRVGTFKGSDLLVSDNVIMGNFPDTGPGPQTLQKGDWNLGYFGVVAPADLLAFSELYAQLGLSGGGLQTDGTNAGWHKFIRDGSIIYLPITPLLTGVSWNNLYDSGLVYGVDGNGSPPAGSVAARHPTKQKRVVTKGTYTFWVRSLKGSTKGPSVILSINNDGFDNSEWAETISRLLLASSLPSNSTKWADLATTATCLTQHVRSSVNALTLNGETWGTVAMTGAAGFLPVPELKL